MGEVLRGKVESVIDAPVNKFADEVEEGEITDSDEELETKMTENKASKENRKSNSPKDKTLDLRVKLRRKSGSAPISDENARGSSDKENVDTIPIKPPKPVNSMKKACLTEYSEEDINNKLIPFKKRQFRELQTVERKLKKQIERARTRSRSKSNTPVGNKSDKSFNLSRELKSPIEKLPAKSPRKTKTPTLAKSTVKCKLVSPSKPPIKLCVNLKNIVIAPPSSSSEETNQEIELSVIPPNKTTEQRMHVDDNAVCGDAVLRDISKDLFLTDDSEAEPDSPIKRARSQLTASLRRTRESPKNLCLSSSSNSHSKPKTQIIDEDSGLAPVHKSSTIPLSTTEVNFSNAITSTPAPLVAHQDLQKLQPPAFSSFSSPKKKKKKRVLGRSVTSSN